MELSDKLLDSICNRCHPSGTGKIMIPTDIFKRVIKENPELEFKNKEIVKDEIIRKMNAELA